jgi:hypothetical protein
MPTKQQKIKVSALKAVSILYEGDIYDLALFLLRLDIARTTRTTTRRHTVHGVASHYATITWMKLEDVEEPLVRHGFSLRASIDSDDDAA